MNTFYDIAINLLGVGEKIGAYRSSKLKKLTEGQASALSYLEQKVERGSEYVWIHAASLGEFEQGRPLIEKIKREHPEIKVLLTFFSPSGYEVRKDYPLADIVSYLPLDTPENVVSFLKIVRPKMAIFVKYEFWGNYLQALSRIGIPTYIISAIFRPTQIFFKPWGGLFRKMLQCFTHLYVQDKASLELLASIGIKNVTVAGDTRFDRVTDIMRGCQAIAEADAFVADGKLTIVAGSTWQPDEEFLLPYFNTHPELKLIIAPHEVEPERIAGIEKMLKRKSCRLSTATPEEAATADCIIVDCFGKLSSLYTYGRIAYVGGGFGVGIHNINEAAVYGMPVVFGPKYQKFKEAIDLIAAEGAFSFDKREDFVNIMDKLTGNPGYLAKCGANAAAYIKANLGATTKIYNDLFGSVGK